MRAEAPSSDTARRSLVLGLGCERGTPPDELVALAVSVIACPQDVAFVATLDARAQEPAMHAVARHFSAPLVTFPADRLEAETPRLANPSDLVFAYTGCHGVAEAAALAQAGMNGRLVVEKTKSAQATVAVAECFQSLASVPSASDSAPSHSDSSREHA
ncbi:MAG: cobalamin biosynthesis protein [Shinella sp.]|uniref:cobalamin biosynthesis protein n=1 Tax=Shinella sp. TaxID=1870904 RepID=UPI003C74BCCF